MQKNGENKINKREQKEIRQKKERESYKVSFKSCVLFKTKEV